MKTKLMQEVYDRLKDGPKVCVSTHRVIEDLVEAGYIRLLDARVGPLGVHTGEKMAQLTEAAVLLDKLWNLAHEMNNEGLDQHNRPMLTLEEFKAETLMQFAQS